MQPGYIPWLGFFELMQRADVFYIYDIVKFDKNGWRNRNRIKTPTGPLWLTVPVNSSNSPLLCDIKIDNRQNWRKKHLKTLELNYSKAPFFENYYQEFKNIINKDHDKLNDLNIEIIKFLSDSFNIKTKIVVTSELPNVEELIRLDRIERLIRLCSDSGAKMFYEAAGGKGYITDELNRFKSFGIDVIFQEITASPYNQLYGDFIPKLSSLDLLFNEGGKVGRSIIIQSGENNKL
jgi:hypothetical protein